MCTTPPPNGRQPAGARRGRGLLRPGSGGRVVGREDLVHQQARFPCAGGVRRLALARSDFFYGGEGPGVFFVLLRPFQKLGRPRWMGKRLSRCNQRRDGINSSRYRYG